MKSDEGFSNMLDKTILIDCLNENVIVPTQNKIQKGEFLLAFFYACCKNLQ
jgi:hypothetical protein